MRAIGAYRRRTVRAHRFNLIRKEYIIFYYATAFMIEIQNVYKRFGSIQALSDISLTIRKGEIFGLIGSNGAGKSTLLRIVSGVYKPDSGKAFLEDREIFENTQAKERIFYISDDQFYLPSSTPADMFAFYAQFYRLMDSGRFDSLLAAFGLDPKRKISTFSKGMKKQLSMILGISANTDYLLCDESFDGLDPVAKQAVKSLLTDAIRSRELTPVIASHNLLELEDLCDHVGLLHKGGVILSREVSSLRPSAVKLQAVFDRAISSVDLAPFQVLRMDNTGSLYTIVIRCDEHYAAERLTQKLDGMKPIFYEMLPLSLEEIFITESEVAGYDLRSIIE